jgi:2-dehydropantoate 2-reductase
VTKVPDVGDGRPWVIPRPASVLSAMRILIVGAGVIGTVYGAHLAAATHAVSILSHEPRTGRLAAAGLVADDVLNGSHTHGVVDVVADPADREFDLVLVCVRNDQLAAACARLTGLRGEPVVLFFGNNPGGRSTISDRVRGTVMLGFPGVGGVLRDGTAEYVRIPQQPTALQTGHDARLDEFERTLRGRGLAVQRVPDMDGWLVYHAAFVACVAAALYRCGTDPGRLAANRPALNLMCAALTQAFTALRRAGVRGLPRGLAVLHARPLTAVAVRYWSRLMRSPMGELCFAAHCRHAEPEMQALASEISARTAGATRTGDLHRLLDTASPETAAG